MRTGTVETLIVGAGDALRTFVASSNAGGLAKGILQPDRPPDARGLTGAILAGYAWDRKNAYVAEPERRLSLLEASCAG